MPRGIYDHIRKPIEDRFWPKVKKSNGCWIWMGCKNDRGYGQICDNSGGTFRMVYAHRFVYELVIRSIPKGLTIDHLCRNRSCVRPDHLEIVTIKENTLRGNGPSGRESRQTHCLHGHPFIPENTYFRRDRWGRQCKTCVRSRSRARKKAILMVSEKEVTE